MRRRHLPAAVGFADGAPVIRLSVQLLNPTEIRFARGLLHATPSELGKKQPDYDRESFPFGILLRGHYGGIVLR
jgi:hypothetical protein